MLTPAEAEAQATLLTRLNELITSEDAPAIKRASACAMLGKLGPHGKSGVPSVLAFIESQLSLQGATQRYYYSDRQNVTQILFPAGTNARLTVAVEALGNIGPDAKAAVPVLIRLAGAPVLENPKAAGEKEPAEKEADPKTIKSLRATAATALGKIGGPESLMALTKLLNTEKSVDTRMGAVEGVAVLAKSTEKEIALQAQAQLRVVSEVDDDKTIRDAATEALTPPKK
jgi:HEAT repeat protein